MLPRAAAALALTVCIARGNEVICFEAEAGDAVEAPMRIADATNGVAAKIAAGASGRRFIEVPEGAGKPPEMTAGRIAYVFDVVEGGQYELWGRAWWDDECGNSMTFCVDGQAPFTFGQDATYKVWHWVKAPARLKQLALAPGRHTLVVRNREDGVRLDQILLTNDGAYVPVDVESVTVAAPR